MNLPNSLTIARLILTGLFAAALYMHGQSAAAAALLIFALAAFTDWLDGHMARRYGLVTVFGKIMDPVADKFLTLTAFFILAYQGVFPLEIVCLIAMREILVTFSRIQLMQRGRVIPAEHSGKIKTVLQVVTILSALIFRFFLAGQTSSAIVRNHEFLWYLFLNVFIMVCAVVTLSSGLAYFRALRSPGILFSKEKV